MLTANGVAAVMAPLEPALPSPWEESMTFRSAAFACGPMTNLDRVRAVHACRPSYHVCWSLALPAPPQFLNQEPPRAQQLLFPDFEIVAHAWHVAPMVVVIRSGVFYAKIGQRPKQQNPHNSHRSILLHRMSLGLTFAGIRALRPPVIYVFVCSTSAVLVPSAARGAAADSAGCRERAALRTREGIRDR